MGSWSVACGISHIAITSGIKCVILPLKKHSGSEYHKYQPATLPIFGEYNDYGGMENIIEDDNTKLIEEHFGVTIDEFVEFLVDGKFTYERDEAVEISGKIKNLEEVKDWRFMWIDRKVYETMLTDVDEWHKGYGDYGTPEMLKLLGFEQVPDAVCENYDAKRFNQLWQNKDGVKFYSDGHTLLAYAIKGGRYVYHYGHGDETSLETYFEVPKELEYLKTINKSRAWRLLNESNRKKEFGWVMGSRYEFDGFSAHLEEAMIEIANSILSKKQEDMTEEDKIQLEKLQAEIHKEKSKLNLLLHRKYYADFEKWGDRIVDLLQLIKNLHPMSHELLPHTLYLTPQCGEYEEHQFFLNRFAEINLERLNRHDDADPDQILKNKKYSEEEVRQIYETAWNRGRANESTNIKELLYKINNIQDEEVV